MKRRDEAGKAERGPFSTGLAGQAARQAWSQAQSSIYAQMPPPPHLFFLLYTLHVSSARCTVLSKDHLGGRWRGRKRDFKACSTNHVFVARSHCLSRSPSSLTSSASIQLTLIWGFKRCLMLKNLPRSVFVGLPPSLPSVPLPPSSLCIFHLLVVTLSNDSIYLRKQCPIYLGVGKGQKKNFRCCHLICHQHFCPVIISNIQRREGGRQLFDSALSYLPNTKLKWMSLTLSQLHESHLNKPLILFYLFKKKKILFLTVHQPSFDPLECIMRSQIKRTWQGINKQPHYLLLRDASIRLSFWGIYFQTFVQFLCLMLIRCIFTLLPPTWDD